MIGELTAQQIEDVLMSQVIGHVGCHADGRTYVVPMTYAYDGRSIVGHTVEGLKVQIMRVNPDVCFGVERVDDLANWQSVIAWGRFRELTGTEAAAAMGLLVDKVLPKLPGQAPGQEFSVTPQSGTPGLKDVVYCIDLTERTGRYEKRSLP